MAGSSSMAVRIPIACSSCSIGASRRGIDGSMPSSSATRMRTTWPASPCCSIDIASRASSSRACAAPDRVRRLAGAARSARRTRAPRSGHGRPPGRRRDPPAGAVARSRLRAPRAAGHRDRINNVSIVLYGEVGGRRFLLTGDIEQDIDPIVLARGIRASTSSRSPITAARPRRRRPSWRRPIRRSPSPLPAPTTRTGIRPARRSIASATPAPVSTAPIATGRSR